MGPAEGCFSFEGNHGLFRGLPSGVSAGFTTGTGGGREAAPRLARGLAAALGVPAARIALSRQVHGRGVLVVDAATADRSGDVVGVGDALMTRERGILLGVQSADCVPLLLADTEGPWIAAVHAGWRGTAARILDAVLELLEERGIPASRLVAAIGPCISQDRYEVGPEVVEALAAGHAPLDVPAGAVRPGRHDRSHVDVAAFNKALLAGRGLSSGSILDAALCTADRPDLFPSYRRDGKGAGRIVTGILRRSLA
ncbi:MAG TPA: polyphenol oxidase family protein [Thermoanaerobaculia bacterium]|nr:polyphenol oxidase family protein [Thermoanaerobaculia bacterium]